LTDIKFAVQLTVKNPETIVLTHFEAIKRFQQYSAKEIGIEGQVNENIRTTMGIGLIESHAS
jgi:hypothetical protein